MQGYSPDTVPQWAVVLKAAEAWGTPPWIIEHAPGSARWLRRATDYWHLQQMARDGDTPEDD